MWQRGGDIKLERLLPIAKLLLKESLPLTRSGGESFLTLRSASRFLTVADLTDH